MRKLFSFSGCFALFILIAVLAFFVYPVDSSTVLIGGSIGLCILAGTHYGLLFFVKSSVLNQSETFQVPDSCNRFLLWLIAMSALFFYATFYKLDVRPISAQSVFTLRFLSVLTLSASVLSWLHWPVLKSDLYQMWCKAHLSYHPEEMSQIESIEAEEAA